MQNVSSKKFVSDKLSRTGKILWYALIAVFVLLGVSALLKITAFIVLTILINDYAEVLQRFKDLSEVLGALSADDNRIAGLQSALKNLQSMQMLMDRLSNIDLSSEIGYAVTAFAGAGTMYGARRWTETQATVQYMNSEKEPGEKVTGQ